MATIEVREGTSPDGFEILVRDGRSETRHLVTARPGDVARLAPNKPARDALEAAFRFLLDREPQESILRRFDLTDISRYFPEFERELAGYLARGAAG